MIDDKSVVNSTYFANWADIFGFPLARWILPYVVKIKFLTPNFISICGFIIYSLGSISLFLTYPYHLLVSALFLPLGFLLDDLDGQVARVRKLSSKLGDYLDKTLDVLKIYIITVSLAIASFQRTGEVFYLFLGFTACFFFLFRYYIKLETVFSRIRDDKNYLDKSAKVKKELTEKIHQEYQELAKTFVGRVKLFWHRNKLIFFVDEAEFAIVTAFFALINRVEWALWIIASAQVIVGIFRLWQRGYQLTQKSEELFKPMRK